MSKLFSVSTDFLLKDEEEIEEYLNEDSNLQKLTVSDANIYLSIKKDNLSYCHLGYFYA